MRKSRILALGLAAAGFIFSGSVFAQGWYYEDRDLRHDYAKSDRLRADIARDQARLNEAYRRGRWREAERIRRDLDKDYRKLDALNRDIRHDQRDRQYDRGNNGGYYGGYR